MTRNAYRMTGLIVMMVSVYLIIAGLFLKGDTVPSYVAPICLSGGIILLIIGIAFYKILKTD